MWKKAGGNAPSRSEDMKRRAQYRAAIAILKDYAGTNGFFGAKVTLFFKGHLRRHHTNMIAALLQERVTMVSDAECRVSHLLQHLQNKFITNNKNLAANGSLARRLVFIQSMTGKNLIDVNNIRHVAEETAAKRFTRA